MHQVRGRGRPSFTFRSLFAHTGVCFQVREEWRRALEGPPANPEDASTSSRWSAPPGGTCMPEFDTIIKDGTIVDGTRMPRYRSDVAIKDGRIAKIGRLRTS